MDVFWKIPGSWRYRRAALLCAVLLITAQQAPQAAHVHRDAAENAARFEQIWRTTRDHFYDPKMHGLDWNAVGDRYREQARAATSRLEFQAIVNRMLGELHASHIGYYTDDDLEYYLLQSLFRNDLEALQIEHIGVLGERDHDAYVVRAILDGSPAARAGVRVGDRLIEADGRPFTTVGAFRGRAGRPTRLVLDRPGTGRMELTVTPVRQNPQQAFLEATKQSARVVERGGRRLGYIHLWTMTNERFKEALESALTGKLANTDGLILDLRDGFGGRPFRFSDVFYRPDVVWDEAGRGTRHAVAHTGYAQPLVVLINGGTRSAKEFLSYQLKKSGRGTLVGTATAGAFLGAGGFPIEPDGYLELPIVDLEVDGRRLEGVGVVPDIVVNPGDAYGPNDRQVARAADILLDKVRAARSSAVAP